MATASEWAEHVAAWRASGKSSREFCVGRGYSAHALLAWSSRLGRRARSRPQKTVPLARVVVEKRRETPQRGAAVVVQVGGARVEIMAGTDRTTLATVFDVLLGRRAL